jgi:hypothetical protein
MQETKLHYAFFADKKSRYLPVSILFFMLSAQAKPQTSIRSAEEVANAEKNFAKKALQTQIRKKLFLNIMPIMWLSLETAAG